MRLRHFAVLALMLAACGAPKKSNAKKTADAGTGASAACVSSADCSGAACVNGLCAAAAPCQNDQDCVASGGGTCSLLTGTCSGAGGSTGSTGTTGGSCTDHYGCSTMQACVGGACTTPKSDGSCGGNNDCAIGQVCNLTNKCEPGCVDMRDCSGGLLCNSSSGKCEPCGSGNDCPSGLSCVDAMCVATTSCNDKSACGAGFACMSHVCGNCKATTDCAASGYDATTVCNAGKCTPPPCTDAQCQSAAMSAGDPKYSLAYCNLSPAPGQNPGCDKHQCNADADCPTGESCGTNHACATPSAGGADGGTPGTNCPMVCPSGLICDPGGSGQCVSQSSGSGANGKSCMSSADCSTGYSCQGVPGFIQLCTEPCDPSTKTGTVDHAPCQLACNAFGIPSCL